jgi:hypothetical protein
VRVGGYGADMGEPKEHPLPVGPGVPDPRPPAPDPEPPAPTPPGGPGVPDPRPPVPEPPPAI